MNANQPDDQNPIVARGRLLLDPQVPPELGWVVIEHGRIAYVGFGDPPRDASPQPIGTSNHLITPAFIDAHIHLPQVNSVGCDGLPLLEWLDQVIYPAEQWWGQGYAVASARTAVRRMLREGTAGFAGYLTSHAQPAGEVLRFLSTNTPMRFIAGRVAMDRNSTNELTAEDRSRATTSPIPVPVAPNIDDDPRHAVSANPRFAIACTDELLAELGWYIRENPGTFIQTHLSESVPECEFTRELFPNDASYTAVYDRFGLLTPQSLLAHCVHLSDDEWSLIAQWRSVVVHCPTANLFLRSGLFNLDKAREYAVPLALGSDVAGGPDFAMPRVARAMIETAKLRALQSGGAGVHIPTPPEVWRLITLGNAQALGWDDQGQIAPGAAADLLLLRPPPTWFDSHLIGRLLYGWSSRLIDQRIVAGTFVDPATITPEATRA